MSPRLVALRAATALAIVVAALLLWQMREAAQLLAVAVAVSAGLAPLVDRLSARGMPRPRAAALIFGGGLLTLLAAAVGLGYLLAVDLAQLAERLPAWYARARAAMAAGGGWLPALAEAMPPSEALTAALVGADVDLGGALLALALQVLTLTALTLGAAALGFYWLMDERRITRLWLSLLPVGARTRVRALGAAIYSEVGVYVRSVGVLVVLTTAALLLIYKLAGVPGASALALLGGVAQVVPLLGPPLAIIPAALVVLAQGGWGAAVALAAAVVSVAAIRLVLAPRLASGGVSVNPVLVVVVIMALAELGGIPLILLAPPLAAALQAATRALVDTGRTAAGRTRAAQIDELEERLAAVAAETADDSDAIRVRALAERARALLAAAQRAV